MFFRKGNTMKEWTDDRKGGGGEGKKPSCRLTLLMLACIFMFVSCTGKYISINPTTDETLWEGVGRDTGIYLKSSNPRAVKNAESWVAGALLLSDEEILNGEILSTVYKYLLDANPDNAEIIMITKNTLTILGVKINLNLTEALPEEKAKYIRCARAVLKGYSEAVK